eukprot:1427358-Prymnesium_polylepis.2
MCAQCCAAYQVGDATAPRDVERGERLGARLAEGDEGVVAQAGDVVEREGLDGVATGGEGLDAGVGHLRAAREATEPKHEPRPPRLNTATEPRRNPALAATLI